jgi:excisionase family DNA binding protein
MLLATKQAAERLQVHPATIRRWAASGRLRFVRIGRERAIPIAEVSRLQRARGGPTRDKHGGRGGERSPGAGNTQNLRFS